MYSKANVTGPREFGELPRADRIFWSNWLDEKISRQNEEKDELEKELS